MQSALLWYRMLKELLEEEEDEFVVNLYNPCVANKTCMMRSDFALADGHVCDFLDVRGASLLDGRVDPVGVRGLCCVGEV